MRPVHLADLHFAAMALCDYPEADRSCVMDRALWQADIADRYRKRLRRAHPAYGTGTLSSAIWDGRAVSQMHTGDHDYLQCLLIVITAMLNRLDRANMKTG
jgi:hypothetical protein